MELISKFFKNAGELIYECVLFAILDAKNDPKVSLLSNLNEGLLEWDCKQIEKE